MIRESGVVVEKRGSMVTVKIARSPRCGACTSCTGAQDGKSMIAQAHDPFGTSVGDCVEVTNENIHPVRDSFLLFIAPVFLFLVGYLTARELGGLAAGLAGGLVLGAVPFLFLGFQEKRGRFQMQVSRVVGQTGTEHSQGPFLGHDT